MVMIPNFTGALVLGVLLSSSSVFAGDCAEADSLIQKAKGAYAAVDARGFAWVPTETYLADATAERTVDACLDAMIHAQRALDTANAAMKQADYENTAWQSRVPK